MTIPSHDCRFVKTIQRRALMGAALVLPVWLTDISQAASTGLTFRLKGSDFSVSGQVQSYDGKNYIVDTPRFGEVHLDAAKFDCSGSDCPTAPITAKPTAPARPALEKPPVVAALALAQPPARIGSRITLSGTDAIARQLMPQLIEAYATSIKATVGIAAVSPPGQSKYVIAPAGGGDGIEISVRGHGTDQGFADLEKGAAQIVMASRPIAAEESTRLSTLGLGNFRLPTHEHALALDGLMILVAPRNPAVSVSIEQLAQILSGQISDWSQLNLPPGKITVYTAPATIDTTDTLTALLLKPRGLTLTPTAQKTTNNTDLADQVSRDPGGIGISAMIPRPTAKALTVETSCGLIVKPSLFAVKTEEYPLSRQLYLYTAGIPSNPTARALLEFAMSAAAQPIIRNLDYVDRDIQALSFADQTDRLAYALNAAPDDFDLKLARTMISELRARNRLSLTLRFQPITDDLSSKANADLNHLIAYLSAPENLTKRAMLIGFGDATGTFLANLKLSERRTATLYRALLAQAQGKIDLTRLSMSSYGKLAPVACNDSVTHRSLNRRVEVWLQN
ncbi:MAG: phosphate ABC transporter substrate-binding/OmpA family protein [Hyphomicrobiaceae bacterium]